MVTVSACGALIAGACDAAAGAGAAEDTSEATEDETGADEAVDTADALDDTADDETAEEATERAGALAQPDMVSSVRSVRTASNVKILIFFIKHRDPRVIRLQTKKESPRQRALAHKIIPYLSLRKMGEESESGRSSDSASSRFYPFPA